MSKLHAQFDSMLYAKKTLEELKEAGITGAFLDLAGSFDYEYSSEINIAGSSDAPSLSALVLTSGGSLTEIAKVPLIAAANAVSGMACVEDCRDISARLTVRCEDKDKGQVAKLIEKNGGRIFKSFME